MPPKTAAPRACPPALRQMQAFRCAGAAASSFRTFKFASMTPLRAARGAPGLARAGRKNVAKMPQNCPQNAAKCRKNSPAQCAARSSCGDEGWGASLWVGPSRGPARHGITRDLVTGAHGRRRRLAAAGGAGPARSRHLTAVCDVDAAAPRRRTARREAGACPGRARARTRVRAGACRGARRVSAHGTGRGHGRDQAGLGWCSDF